MWRSSRGRAEPVLSPFRAPTDELEPVIDLGKCGASERPAVLRLSATGSHGMWRLGAPSVIGVERHGVRRYCGGRSEATAFVTVVREIPNRLAICAFDTPSASSLRINAQSSKVITLQSLRSVHFSPSKPTSFRPSSTPVRWNKGQWSPSYGRLAIRLTVLGGHIVGAWQRLSRDGGSFA
jgi:hypothetical protein